MEPVGSEETFFRSVYAFSGADTGELMMIRLCYARFSCNIRWGEEMNPIIRGKVPLRGIIRRHVFISAS